MSDVTVAACGAPLAVFRRVPAANPRRLSGDTGVAVGGRVLASRGYPVIEYVCNFRDTTNPPSSVKNKTELSP